MPHEPRRFTTTRWTLVQAVREPGSPDATAALASLCEIYWFPVYVFIRRTGASVDDARDLTQAFFARVLEKGAFGEARRERGRFRAFLLAAVRHFLANERDAARAQKRGGGQRHVSLEFDDGERQYSHEPIDAMTPEQLYERRWATAVRDAALARLSEKYASPERRLVFLALQPSLTSHAADVGAVPDAGMTDGALRVAMHRLRRQFAACLRDVIRETVAKAEDLDDELRHVMTLLVEQ